MSRYTGPCRIRIHGPQGAGAAYVGLARTLLGEQMGIHVEAYDSSRGLASQSHVSKTYTPQPAEQIQRRVSLPNGVRIQVQYNTFMPVIDIWTGDFAETRDFIPECHTGLFVQNSFAGLLEAPEDDMDFFLALNNVRLTKGTARIVRNDQFQGRIDTSVWAGPIHTDRDKVSSWHVDEFSWARFKARDDISCYVQKDPVNDKYLYGGMSNNCGTSVINKRFWVGITPLGKKLYFHHNLYDINHGFPTDPLVLNVRVTTTLSYEWEEEVDPDGPVIADLEIELPDSIDLWAFYPEEISCFVCDIHPSGLKVLFGLTTDSFVMSYGGRPVRLVRNIIELDFTPVEEVDATGEIIVSDVVSSLKVIVDSSESYTVLQNDATATVSDEFLFVLAPAQIIASTPDYKIAEIDAGAAYTETGPNTNSLVGPAYLLLSHAIGGGGDTREWADSSVIGAFYGLTDLESTELSVQLVTFVCSETRSSRSTLSSPGDVTVSGLIWGKTVPFAGEEDPDGGGSITIEVPAITSSRSWSHKTEIYMGQYKVLEFTCVDNVSSNSGSFTRTIEYMPDSKIFLRAINTERVNSVTSTGNQSSWPEGVFVSHPSWNETDSNTINQSTTDFLVISYSDIEDGKVNNAWNFSRTRPPGTNQNYTASFGESWDAFGWLYLQNFYRESFIDFHGGCKVLSVWEAQSTLELGPETQSIVYRSKFVAWDDTDQEPIYVGQPVTHLWGPAIYSDFPEDFGKDYFFEISPLYDIHDCASYNPVTKQLAYGFSSPVCWQGDWGGYDLENPWGGCTDEVLTLYTPEPPRKAAPFGVAKLVDPVYVPAEGDSGYVLGWTGTPLPDDDPGCPSE